MPEVKWYASERMLNPSDYLGIKMLEDCIEYMTTAPESPAKGRNPGKGGSQKSLIDDTASSDEDMEELKGKM